MKDNRITIDKSRYEDIIFDNTRKLTAKKSRQGTKFREVIFSGVDVVAERVITPKGVTYYEYQ